MFVVRTNYDEGIKSMDPVITEHCAHLVRLNRRPGTVYQRQRTLTRLQQHIAPMGLLDATLEDLRSYIDRPARTPTRRLGDEAMYGEVSRIQSFYRWAALEELITADPSLRLERPHRPDGVPRPMPRADVERALAEAPEPLRTWYLLAVRAGLRACEIAPVRTRDITGGLLIIPVQKGGGMGAVPVSPGLAAALSHHVGQPGWWFPHGTDPDRHVTAAQVSKRANQWLHANGIPHTLHSLRHRFGTDVYRLSGYDLLLTARLGRWRGLDTPRRYAQLEDNRASSVVAMLDVA